MKAVVAVLAIFVVLFIYPGPSAIYDVLAQPMLASLPAGTRMIATGVITPFMVPIKVTMLAAFVLALPVVLFQARSEEQTSELQPLMRIAYAAYFLKQITHHLLNHHLYL